MPYNGSGSFSPPGADFPAVANTLIESTKFNNVINDIATGLSTAITKDGQTTVTANIPFAGNRLTGVGAGSAATDAANVNQLRNGAAVTLGTIAGTNTITAVGSPVISAYAANQYFRFTPAATITGAATINIDGLGDKNIYINGAACVGGELTINVPAEILYDGTQFNLLNPCVPKNTSYTASLGADVNLNNISNYFDGPSVAQGTVGKWLVTGTVTMLDTGNQASYKVRITDGTTVIASGRMTAAAIGEQVCISVSGIANAPVGNLKIQVNDPNGTAGKIVYNSSGNALDSTINAVRIG